MDKIELQDLDILQLSYENIFKIQNLGCTARLTKLQLDNNLIEKIENLDHLKNLKWLDLSFNFIKKIEGLDNLLELQDISLYNNQITKVEGLENNLKLNVFSIGNNLLADFTSLLTLFGKNSKFKNLQVLNVAGNPYVQQEPNYDQDLIFYIMNLKYIDYKYIDENKRQQISEIEKYQSDNINSEDYKAALQREEENEIERINLKLTYQQSGMDKVIDFEKEIVNDQDLDKIKILDGIDEEIIKFQDKTKEFLEGLKTLIVKECNIKKKNEKLFQEAVRAREIVSEQETLEKIKQFEQKKKRVMRKFEKEEEDARESLDELFEQLEQMKKELLQIEMELIDDLEQAKKDFDAIISNFQKETDIITKNAFLKITDYIQKEFMNQCQEICKQQFEKYNNDQQAGKDQNNQNWTDEQAGLLENRETWNQTLSQLKETLSTKIYMKETDVTKFFTNDIKQFTDRFIDVQYERNRNNVQNIHNQIESFKIKLNAILTGNESESDRD